MIHVPNPLVEKLEHFVRLASADRDMLDRISSDRQRRFGAREDIIREGDRPEHINLVMSGWACRYKVLEDGRRQIIAFFLPGDLCDLNVFVLRQMDHSIGAMTDVVISEISRPGFDELMLEHPRVTQARWWESLVAAATVMMYLDTRISENCVVGARAIVLPGVTVGAGCTIAPGALVNRDVPAGSTVVGNPGRIEAPGPMTAAAH